MTEQRTKPAIPLRDAAKLSNDLRSELLPYCERVWTAGSVRRHKPFVGDIELVIIPKPGAEPHPTGRPEPEPEGQRALFGAASPLSTPPVPSADQLTDYLETQCDSPSSPWEYRLNVAGRRAFGPKNKLLVYNDYPVDVFSGSWANFGMLFFVRTGDADWVVEVMAEFKRQKRHGHPYGGVEYMVDATGLHVPAQYVCRREEDVFELLGWPFVNAPDRTRERARELRGKRR